MQYRGENKYAKNPDNDTNWEDLHTPLGGSFNLSIGTVHKHRILRSEISKWVHTYRSYVLAYRYCSYSWSIGCVGRIKPAVKVLQDEKLTFAFCLNSPLEVYHLTLISLAWIQPGTCNITVGISSEFLKLVELLTAHLLSYELLEKRHSTDLPVLGSNTWTMKTVV